METTSARLFSRHDFGHKGMMRAVEVQVGNWYKFQVSNEILGYGKVTRITNDGYCEVEKYFELPKYRPYASHNWFDDLKYALMTEEEEKLFA